MSKMSTIRVDTICVFPDFGNDSLAVIEFALSREGFLSKTSFLVFSSKYGLRFCTHFAKVDPFKSNKSLFQLFKNTLTAAEFELSNRHFFKFVFDFLFTESTLI